MIEVTIVVISVQVVGVDQEGYSQDFWVVGTAVYLSVMVVVDATCIYMQRLIMICIFFTIEVYMGSCYTELAHPLILLIFLHNKYI